MGGGFACEYEEIHTLSQCVSLAEHRHNAVRAHTHTQTLPFGSKASGCHGNSRRISLGLRLRMRAGAKRPLLINGNSQTSCGHLAPIQIQLVFPTAPPLPHPPPLDFFTFPASRRCLSSTASPHTNSTGRYMQPLARFYSSATVQLKESMKEKLY